MREKLISNARKRFISSLMKNLILVFSAATLGGEYLFKLTGTKRIIFFIIVGIAMFIFFSVGLWLAVDNEKEDP